MGIVKWNEKKFLFKYSQFNGTAQHKYNSNIIWLSVIVRYIIALNKAIKFKPFQFVYFSLCTNFIPLFLLKKKKASIDKFTSLSSVQFKLPISLVKCHLPNPIISELLTCLPFSYLDEMPLCWAGAIYSFLSGCQMKAWHNPAI